MKQKQFVIAGIILVVVLGLGGAAFALLRNSSSAPTEAQPAARKKAAPPVNEIALTDRPVITISPEGTRSLKVGVASLPKPASSVEYELEYQAGNLLQGAFGQLQLSAIPVSASVLLGSCSAGGACTYHEDVQGGSILLRFDGDSPYALKADWRYQKTDRNTATISSRDAKFVAWNNSFAKNGVVVIFNGSGHFPNLPGTPVSDPYAFSSNFTITSEVQISIRASEANPSSIYGWDGNAWQKLTTSIVEDKEIVATGPAYQQYVAVKE